ncbi:hypothetical protein WMZ97_10965 [Lentibacillus sp. N15]|uniref:hypothetical protein n=1 Tax=Lentibacillus songyuanensis TaxID=3136161 RepID=UPI0031B9C95B
MGNKLSSQEDKLSSVETKLGSLETTKKSGFKNLQDEMAMNHSLLKTNHGMEMNLLRRVHRDVKYTKEQVGTNTK